MARLVIDIETIPCLETARMMYPNLSCDDDLAVKELLDIRVQESGKSFMRLPLQKIVCLSYLYQDEKNFVLRSLTGDEKSILSTIVRAFNKKPELIGFNSKGFDLPVMLGRMAKYGVVAQDVFNRHIKNADYTHKFNTNHVDLMDEYGFGAYGNKNSLLSVASMLGIPCKSLPHLANGDDDNINDEQKATIDGSSVYEYTQKGDIQTIADYCESDVIATFLCYLKHRHLTGELPTHQYNYEIALFRQVLENHSQKNAHQPHQHYLNHACLQPFAINMDGGDV